jgi:hypothetical protein
LAGGIVPAGKSAVTQFMIGNDALPAGGIDEVETISCTLEGINWDDYEEDFAPREVTLTLE